MTRTRRVLIVDMGVAGMAAAIRLQDAGWTPVLVERAPERRTGGYFIGLFPKGKEAADRLGALAAMHLRTPSSSRSWELGAHGDRHRSAGFLDQDPRPEGVLRGDIEQALWDRMGTGVEVRFSTEPERIVDSAGGALVTLRDHATGDSTEEMFDLVVGADGLRSTVRRLAFGPDEDYLRPMNAVICAFQLRSQVPKFDENDAIVLAEPGRALWVFPFDDRPPTALLTYRTDDVNGQFTAPPLEVLRARYEGMSGDGAIEHVLQELEDAPDSLFDSVHQVKMPTWHRGRVVLLGDSAWCLTLYSGAGATAGMVGAVALGDALEEHPDSLDRALSAWEDELRPFIKKSQLDAHVKGQIFVPSNAAAAWLRTAVLSRAGKRVVAKRLDAPVLSA